MYVNTGSSSSSSSSASVSCFFPLDQCQTGTQLLLEAELGGDQSGHFTPPSSDAHAAARGGSQLTELTRCFCVLTYTYF